MLPPRVIPALNVAAPAASISKSNAVISTVASTPLNRRCLLFTADLTTKSEVLSLNRPISTVFFLKMRSPPCASRVISPAASRRSAWSESISPSMMVKLPALVEVSTNNSPFFTRNFDTAIIFTSRR